MRCSGHNCDKVRTESGSCYTAHSGGYATHYGAKVVEWVGDACWAAGARLKAAKERKDSAHGYRLQSK